MRRLENKPPRFTNIQERCLYCLANTISPMKPEPKSQMAAGTGTDDTETRCIEFASPISRLMLYLRSGPVVCGLPPIPEESVISGSPPEIPPTVISKAVVAIGVGPIGKEFGPTMTELDAGSTLAIGKGVPPIVTCPPLIMSPAVIPIDNASNSPLASQTRSILTGC